jgi:hypothetical protein
MNFRYRIHGRRNDFERNPLINLDLSSIWNDTKKDEGKAVSVQACTSSEVSRRLRLPHFPDNRRRNMGNLSAPAAFTSYDISLVSILLEAESTPGP